MVMLNINKEFQEGEIFVKWVNNRIAQRKNVIAVTTGATGSGKSYSDLRRAELVHRSRFNEEFPIENCCFSLGELMRRISSGNLRKGEVLILEEAGVNVGSGDWQNKIIKMFNYVLQSFRSMNIVLFMNLPTLTMLAKQARELVHLHIETCGIDYDSSLLIVKALFHQLNQSSGKSYWKYLRIVRNGKVVRVERMCFGLPSKELLIKYEQKKAMFVSNLTQEFSNEIEQKERDKMNKMARKELSVKQVECFNYMCQGMNNQEIANEMKCTIRNIQEFKRMIKKKGYEAKIENTKSMRTQPT